MPYELLSAVASIGTFVVVAATAIAAIIQLRHMRASNQISSMLDLTAEMESAEMQRRFTFVVNELPARMQDPGFRASYAALPIDRDAHPEMYVLDYYHKLGSLLVLDLVDESVILSFEGYRVPPMWERLEPSVAIIRRRAPLAYGGFEYLARRASDEIASGNLVRRLSAKLKPLPLKDVWLEADRNLRRDPELEGR